ncbi:MAG: hypothetical protein ABJA75_04830 [Bradyrhizobium sp.]
MDKKQATEILKNALKALDAIEHAGEIVIKIDKAARLELADPIEEIVGQLNYTLLPAIYHRYPELRPTEGERAAVSVYHCWEDVDLRGKISEAELDAILFSVMRPRWQKTMMVIARAEKRCQELKLQIEMVVLGLRLLVLAESDQIESQGPVRMWRHSEVRLRSAAELS